MKTKSIELVTVGVLLVSGSFANAALISINFHSDAGGETGSTLDGPLGGGSSTWNQSTSAAGTNLVDSTGGSSTVGWAYAHNLEENDIFSGDPLRRMLVGSFAQFGKGEDSTLTISGLEIGGIYNVAIASTRLRNEGTEQSHGIFSTTNVTTSANSQLVDGITSINGDTWELGVNYALFENVVANGSGEISFLADATDAGELFAGSAARRLHVNGFQIVSVPELSSVALLGLGGLALLLRRRK